MSQWYHRNPLKSTSKNSFDIGPIASSIPARSICLQASEKRSKLLSLFTEPNLDVDSLQTATNQYLSLLVGFTEAPNMPMETAKLPSSPDSKSQTEFVAVQPNSVEKREPLRALVTFTWTNSLNNRHMLPMSHADTLFELACVLFNLAMWYSKHAAKVSAKESISEEESLGVHRCLRHAAGLFSHIKTELLPRFSSDEMKPGSDFDPNILDAYILQSLAEAQEVAMARAIEGKHETGLIAALSFETSQAYEKAKLGLVGILDELVAKWRAYLLFKQFCFRAYAYCYHAESLLAQDKCGLAIASAREALKILELGKRAAATYSSASGAGLTARPHDHSFFRRLDPFIRRILSKCESENALIYRQHVPLEMADLALKAVYGVATPQMPLIDFTPNELWQKAVMGFDLSKLVEASLSKKQTGSKKVSKVDPIKEPPIYGNETDPNNASGCVIT